MAKHEPYFSPGAGGWRKAQAAARAGGWHKPQAVGTRKQLAQHEQSGADTGKEVGLR